MLCAVYGGVYIGGYPLESSRFGLTGELFGESANSFRILLEGLDSGEFKRDSIGALSLDCPSNGALAITFFMFM